MMRVGTAFASVVLALAPFGFCGCTETDLPAAAATADSRDGEQSPSAGGGGNPPAENLPMADARTAPRPTAPKPTAATREITFDDIKFDMEKGDPFDRSLLTPEIEALDEQPIRIRGYILPSFQQTGITQFVLVRDNQECCFGPGAALFDCILVEMQPGRSTDYTVRPVAVEGVFSVREVTDGEGTHLAIYHLDGRSVK